MLTRPFHRINKRCEGRGFVLRAWLTMFTAGQPNKPFPMLNVPATGRASLAPVCAGFDGVISDVRVPRCFSSYWRNRGRGRRGGEGVGRRSRVDDQRVVVEGHAPFLGLLIYYCYSLHHCFPYQHHHCHQPLPPPPPLLLLLWLLLLRLLLLLLLLLFLLLLVLQQLLLMEMMVVVPLAVEVMVRMLVLSFSWRSFFFFLILSAFIIAVVFK